MPAIGIGLLWMAYAAGLWGYCFVRGYNVTAKQLLSPSWPPVAATVSAATVGGKGANAVADQIAGNAVGNALNSISGSGPVKAS